MRIIREVVPVQQVYGPENFYQFTGERKVLAEPLDPRRPEDKGLVESVIVGPGYAEVVFPYSTETVYLGDVSEEGFKVRASIPIDNGQSVLLNTSDIAVMVIRENSLHWDMLAEIVRMEAEAPTNRA
jgi:hypothetical protein